MLDDLTFQLGGDAQRNLVTIQKKLSKEGAETFSEVNGTIREGSEPAGMKFWQSFFSQIGERGLENQQTFDFDCNSSAGPCFVAVHVADSFDITNLEFYAMWEPAKPVSSLSWEESGFVAEDDSSLPDKLNIDPDLKSSVRKLISHKYRMGNTTISIPNPSLTVRQEDTDAVLSVQTTMKTLTIPFFNILLSFKFGVNDFVEVLRKLKAAT